MKKFLFFFKDFLNSGILLRSVIFGLGIEISAITSNVHHGTNFYMPIIFIFQLVPILIYCLSICEKSLIRN